MGERRSWGSKVRASGVEKEMAGELRIGGIMERRSYGKEDEVGEVREK